MNRASVFALFLAPISLSMGAETPKRAVDAVQPAVEFRELTIYPASLPRPALKYHLLPHFRDRIPGNAATLYLKAFLWLSMLREGRAKAVGKLEGEYLTMPLDRLPREEVRKALREVDDVLQLVETASRRAHCDWSTPIGQTPNILTMPLPEVQSARAVARLLHAKVRIAIVERKYDEALSTLRTSFSLARDLGKEPILVSNLVGIALQGISAGGLELLLASPGSPNLYWAVTELPTPLVGIREGLEVEGESLSLLFPDLRDVKTAYHPPEQWEKLLARILELRESAADEPMTDRKSPMGSKPPMEERKEPRKPDVGAFLGKAYPIARRELAERGWSDKQLDPMPRAQVALIAAAETYETARDDLFKWEYVPYWRARDMIRATAKEIAELRQKELLSLTSALLPSVNMAHLAQTRMERELAAIRCIEAIRAYAAAHQGKLPQSLDQITNVPVPDNPLTGKRFPYRLENQTGILDVEGPPESVPRQYRLRLAK